MIEEFNNWKDYNETVKGIASDEFNSLDLWFDYNNTASIVNEASGSVSSTNFFQFF